MGPGKCLIACLICIGVLAVAPAADASDGFFGVMPQGPVNSADFDQMKGGGIETVRVPFTWYSMEPYEGVFNWSYTDQVVGDSARAGLDVLPVLYGTPSWIDHNFKVMPSSGAALDRWNEMLTQVTERYGEGGTFWAENPSIPAAPINTWQIWNESNTVWFADPIDPVQYAQLVIDSSKTIRDRDANDKVMLAGMMASPPSNIGPSGDDYLKILYQVPGFRDAFDYAAVQPYNASLQDSMDDIARMRQVLVSRDDSKKGLYVTEVGWGSDSLTGLGRKSQAGQAQRLEEAYQAFLGARKSLNILGVYWFAWQDRPANSPGCSFCFGNGLLDAKGVPKLAWAALKNVIKNEGSGVPLVKCVVPRLKGRKLKTARRLLRKAHCGIRVVNRRRQPAGPFRVGTVFAQSPGASVTRPAKTKVRVNVARQANRKRHS
jgi:Beta-galactosidase